ncbi:MAG TPA: hypothetical protein H9867_06045 [Candidatus Corynebacterium gallistercoris]|uniref:DUF8185 domain-containing protein n=1 Tax=Candidatus Corynebacterium gallistercoris TaxID=2838530 RepID=A0A9D1UQ72_9CORY|nr:hypothetical protein [Candidatus Corynebacterium gallistercoris]
MTLTLNLAPALAPATPHATKKAGTGALRRAQTVLRRALAMDAQAMVRARQAGPRSVDLFITTPLKAIVSQRIPGTLEGETTSATGVDHAVTGASQLAEALSWASDTTTHVPFGPALGLVWPGALPPEAGYDLVDTVPGETLRALHAEIAQESKAHSGPLGVAKSLLEQKVVEVVGVPSPKNNDQPPRVELQGRWVAALGGLGLIAEPTAPQLRDHDYARVAVGGSWIRVDGLFGSLYAPKPGGLARVP